MIEMDTHNQSDIWIGMVEVRPFFNSELLTNAKGAFVNVLAWATDLEEFRHKIEELMEYLHLVECGSDEMRLVAFCEEADGR